MNEQIPWNSKKCAILILILEGEIANLLFMLLKNDVIDNVNNAMDSLGSPSEEEKAEVIIQFHSLLKTRITKALEGKDYALGYLQKTYEDTSFFETLFEDRDLAKVSVFDVEAEMSILEDTVVKNLDGKSFFSNVDDLRVEIVKLIVKYPVDAAIIFTILCKG